MSGLGCWAHTLGKEWVQETGDNKRTKKTSKCIYTYSVEKVRLLENHDDFLKYFEDLGSHFCAFTSNIYFFFLFLVWQADQSQVTVLYLD